MATQKELLVLIGTLTNAYPRTELSKQTISLYIEMLADLDIDLLNAAVHQHIAESEWFPTVAALRNKVAELQQMTRQSQDWGAAWGVVMDAANRLGYDEVMQQGLENVFVDPLTLSVVKQIRWREICYADLETLNTLRAQFRDMYQAAQERRTKELKLIPQVREQMAQLAERLDMNKRLSDGKPHSHSRH